MICCCVRFEWLTWMLTSVAHMLALHDPIAHQRFAAVHTGVAAARLCTGRGPTAIRPVVLCPRPMVVIRTLKRAHIVQSRQEVPAFRALAAVEQLVARALPEAAA